MAFSLWTFLKIKVATFYQTDRLAFQLAVARLTTNLCLGLPEVQSFVRMFWIGRGFLLSKINIMLEELENKVIAWGHEKGILTNPNPIKQHDKCIEEVLELRDAIVLYRHSDYNGIADLSSQTAMLDKQRIDIKDGIGDTVVTLIMLACIHHMTLEECLQHAYDEIKDRTGTMVQGEFIKD